jgi:hypothetical protein
MGRVFNHVTRKYLFGFKLLLLGYWDGKSLIPTDFSLHRKKEAKALTAYQKRRLKDDLQRKGTLRAREQSGLKNWT